MGTGSFPARPDIRDSAEVSPELDPKAEVSSLRIELLGRFRVSVDGEVVDEARWHRRGAKALIKILALDPSCQIHRERLMEAFWPGSSPRAAGNNLSKVVYGARRALEPGLRKGADSRFLRRISDSIALGAPGRLWIDVHAFESRSAEAMALDSTGAYEAALSQYRGDLLEEDPYEEWLWGKRDKLKLLHQQLTAKLAMRYEADGRFEDSIGVWTELTRIDSTNEEAHRHLMQLYAKTGHRQQALLQYQRCCESMRDELGVGPDAPTCELHTSILEGRFDRFERSRVVTPAGANADVDSLAVLPFTNASGDPELEFLCEGITDTLINGLAQLPRLRVMARSTVFRYKDRDLEPKTLGRELDVGAVLLGRISQWSERLVIATELVRVGDGSLLWGEQFNREPRDIFEVQEEISRTISEKLRLELSRTEKSLLRKRHTRNSRAYEHYLRGRFHWERRTGASLQKAVECFQAAIDEDPDYALACAGLANCYNILSLYSAVAPAEAMPKAKAAAERALALDDTMAEAHAALAYARLRHDLDWNGAEEGLRRAVELSPGYATAYHWHHVCLTALGRFDEAADRIAEAKRLDPLSLIIHTEFGWGLYYARRYVPAAEHLERTLDMDPRFSVAHLILGMVRAQEERFDEAVHHLRQAIELQDGHTFALAIGALGHAYARSGEAGLARECLTNLADLSERFYVSPYAQALVHAGLGDDRRALACLEQAFEERYDRRIFLNVEPMFDPLRRHPAFAGLIRRLELP